MMCILYRNTVYNEQDYIKKLRNTIVKLDTGEIVLLGDLYVAKLAIVIGVFNTATLKFEDKIVPFNSIQISQLIPPPGYYMMDGIGYSVTLRNNYQWKMGGCADRLIVKAVSEEMGLQEETAYYIANAFKSKHYYPKFSEAYDAIIRSVGKYNGQDVIPLSRNILLTNTAFYFLNGKIIPYTFKDGVITLGNSSCRNELQEELDFYECLK